MDSEFKIIDMGAAHLPVRMHFDDAGMDVYAPYTFTVAPHCKQDVLLGFGTVMPFNYMAVIKPRGSMGRRGLLTVENPIDSGYRGENHAVVWNVSDVPITVEEGERFCQLVFTPCLCCTPEVIKPEDAPSSDRGAGGYGSTGGYHASESNR